VSAERACDLCGSTSSELLYEKDGWPVVRCRSCELVFVGRELSSEDLIALYDETYYEDPAAEGYGGYAAAEDRKRDHNRTLLAELERRIPAGRLLEVGCAYGFFLDEARHRGWEVQGLEPSAHAAAEASRRLGIEIPTTPLTEINVAPQSVDAVVMWDVIEHLPDPRETLRKAAALLRPGGVVALSTGDVGSSAARLHGVNWSLMTPPWHQYYFSRTTLRRMLETTGFENVALSGDGSFAADPQSPRPRVPAPVAAVLGHPQVARVARRLGAGSIMYAFARRSNESG
jgi:2-polyprenyl-3-methyl-5-hydroxy-6-metoxy-1,4-benzoquinol methylase